MSQQQQPNPPAQQSTKPQQSQQQQQQQQMTIQQLKQYIHLSSNKLLELTYSQEKFVSTIVKFIKQAVQSIDRQQHQQALVYLGQAQRVLQYGASCGKSIDRNLIICVLNNEACCYYRQGQLAKCASYLEGVIYNLKAFATSMQSTPTQSSLLSQNFDSKNNKNQQQHDQFYHVSVDKKIQLVYFHLKYCTINSQINKTEIAQKAGKNVVKLVKSIYDDIIFENPKIYPSETKATSSSQSSQTFQDQLKDFKDLIKGQIFFKQQIDVDNLQVYRKLTRVYVKKWNQKKISNRIHKIFEKNIQNYSLSQVIQILPTLYSSNSQKLYQSLVNPKVLLRQLLHLAMGYFTISTQYRLMSQKRYPKSLEQKQKSQQYKSANIYHLMSILFLGINLNSDLLFMKQLITSYQQHYKCEILVEEHLADEELQSLSEKLLFQKRRSKFSKQNQILFQKISKISGREKESGRVSKSKDKSTNGEYKTLNSTKLNISKQITPKTRKRSISSRKQQSSLVSSKRMSQKTSINNSTMNKTKILDQQQKAVPRKRSYSKDSVKQTKKVSHLGVQKFNNNQSTQQRTINEYQLVTPNKKLVTNKPARKRRISSASSGKDVVIGHSTSRQNSKNSKTKMFQFNNKSQKQKQKQKKSTLMDSVKSPGKAQKLTKPPSQRVQKLSQKQKQRQSLKPKKRVQKQKQKQKQVKKKKTIQTKNPYF